MLPTGIKPTATLACRYVDISCTTSRYVDISCTTSRYVDISCTTKITTEPQMTPNLTAMSFAYLWMLSCYWFVSGPPNYWEQILFVQMILSTFRWVYNIIVIYNREWFESKTRQIMHCITVVRLCYQIEYHKEFLFIDLYCLYLMLHLESQNLQMIYSICSIIAVDVIFLLSTYLTPISVFANFPCYSVMIWHNLIS